MPLFHVKVPETFLTGSGIQLFIFSHQKRIFRVIKSANKHPACTVWKAFAVFCMQNKAARRITLQCEIIIGSVDHLFYTCHFFILYIFKLFLTNRNIAHAYYWNSLKLSRKR